MYKTLVDVVLQERFSLAYVMHLSSRQYMLYSCYLHIRCYSNGDATTPSAIPNEDERTCKYPLG